MRCATPPIAAWASARASSSGPRASARHPKAGTVVEDMVVVRRFTGSVFGPAIKISDSNFLASGGFAVWSHGNDVEAVPLEASPTVSSP